MSTSHPWSEAKIANVLAHKLQPGRAILVVPNCHWTGPECDLLVIDRSLRIIDVEIKISRADLKQDWKKDKWWKFRPWSRRTPSKEPRQWPDKVWKHYYVMPHEIWEPGLLAAIPPASGVLTMVQDERFSQGVKLMVMRAAKPCRDAKPICAADCIDIARLASLRMWSALSKENGK